LAYRPARRKNRPAFLPDRRTVAFTAPQARTKKPHVFFRNRAGDVRFFRNHFPLLAFQGEFQEGPSVRPRGSRFAQSR